MSDLAQAIKAELSAMSREQLEAELGKLREKRERMKSTRSANPEARKAYYMKVKDTPEWKAKRVEQANKRKAREEALLALAVERLGAEAVKSLGFRV